MEAYFKRLSDNKNIGYYIDDDIQWASGNDYLKYCLHFDSVFRNLYPQNKTNYTFNNILIVGGGDMQLKSNTMMLREDCLTTLVDPFVHEYQRILVNNEKIIPKKIYFNQRRAYNDASFFNIEAITIQEYLSLLPENHTGFDLIVCDLTDELAVDINNEITSLLYDKLRRGGVMIGYGGLSYSKFMENSILPIMPNSTFIAEERYYQTWNDCGVVYGLIKK